MASSKKRKSNPAIKLAQDTNQEIQQYIGNLDTKLLFGHQELHYYSSFSGWTFREINRVLDLHDNGQFRESELLYNAMTKIPRMNGALHTRTQAIRTLPFRLKIKNGTPDRIVSAIQCLEDNFGQVLSPNDLVELQRRIIMFGFCICSVKKRLIDGYFIPRITPFTHYYLTYDYVFKKYRVWLDNVNYKLVGDSNEEWVVFSSGGIRPWAKGSIRPLANTFAKIIHAYDRWHDYNDFEASSKQILHTPALKREQIEAREAQIKASMLRGGDTFIEPEGYELRYLPGGNGGIGYKAFLDMITECNNELAIELLGNNMAQENKSTGSYASAKVGENIAKDRIVGDIDNLVGGLYNGPMRQFIKWNFTEKLYKTPDPLVSYAPCPEWHPSEDETNDPVTMATAAQSNAAALSAYLTAIQTVGVDINKLDIDWKEQARKCGLAILDNSLVEK
jgi:hypothetical protein